jgi:hypothetical protein
MERVPLDVPNGGQRFEYDNINVHDVVMLEIPWLCKVVDERTVKPFLIPTLHNHNHPTQQPLFMTQ